MKKYEDNYKMYLDYYFKKIKDKYPNSSIEELLVLINDLEKFYSSLPILHSTSIDNIDMILNEGLKSFNNRLPKNRKGSSIFDIDIEMGLSNYVFADIGRIPIYGSEDKRITLLLSDRLCTEDNYFTFIDLAMIYHFSGHDIHSMRERNRIKAQYSKSCLPLNKIWNILSLNALASRTGIQKDNFFPLAIDPDFVHQNGGHPEIKIANSVEKDNILGFVVEGNNSEELKEKLESKGIKSECILVINPNDDKNKQLIEFKRKLVEMYERSPDTLPMETIKNKFIWLKQMAYNFLNNKACNRKKY